MVIVRYIADRRVSVSISNHGEADNHAEPPERISHQAPGAKDYLPGGQPYQELMASARSNPRGDASMSQWLREWDEEWMKASGGGEAACMWPIRR